MPRSSCRRSRPRPAELRTHPAQAGDRRARHAPGPPCLNGAMGRRSAALAVAVLLAAGPLVAPAARANGVAIDLPPAEGPTTAVPPFQPTGALRTERRLPRGRIESDERVQVRVDPAGAPVAVSVRQRLELRGPGDYSLAVPGPIADVEPAPGSAVPPGLRSGALIWQGFSPGHRVLAADLRLRPREAAAALPL